MGSVRLSAHAARDLEQIWAYIAQDSPVAADRFLDRIHRTCLRLADVPRIGRLRNELAKGLRSFPIGRYVIFYRVGGGGIEVARVLSGYQDIEALFDL
jgi:toxin ParE1/3/4